MVWLIAAGLAAGLIGGMGMGGGTVFIPVLTSVFGVSQHVAQWLNLVSFLPMAAVSLTVHAKNRLLDKCGFWQLVLPSGIACVAFSLFAVRVSGRILSVVFAAFLLLMGTIGLISSIRNAWRQRQYDKPHEPPSL